MWLWLGTCLKNAKLIFNIFPVGALLGGFLCVCVCARASGLGNVISFFENVLLAGVWEVQNLPLPSPPPSPFWPFVQKVLQTREMLKCQNVKSAGGSFFNIDPLF